MARAVRWAVLATFGINGLALSSWFPHIPAVQRKLELSDGTLALVLDLPRLLETYAGHG